MKESYVEQDAPSKIHKLSEFNALKQSGFKAARKFYLYIFLPSEQKSFAIILSKKVGNAVKRNYEKRLMRVFIAKYYHLFPYVKCLVIRIPKKEGSFSEKEEDFIKNIDKLKAKFSPGAKS